MSKDRRRLGRLSPRLAALAAVLGLSLVACGGDGGAADQERVIAGLIVKQDTNPYFVQMLATARETAEESNVELLTAAGKSDVDNASQVTALEYMAARGAQGILIVPADSKAIVPTIEKVREGGVTVIALDSPTEPESAVDALFATNNLRAGELIGQYAKAKVEAEGRDAKIAMLDLAPGIEIGELRHNGFLKGYGIRDANPQIVGRADTEGNEEKAQAAMAQLLEEDPDINVIYTINEPAAFGAISALEAAGKAEDDVILVSIDGGCRALKQAVRPGKIDATSQQYPENMAREGVQAIAAAARGGEKPPSYVDTGVELITAYPVDGVQSRDEGWGTRNCWGAEE